MANWDDLSKEQQDRFWANIEKWGLDPSDVHHDVNTKDFGGRCITCDDPKVSHLKTKPLVLKSVAHVKELVGVPDEHFKSGVMSDRFIDYPDDIPEHRLQKALEAPHFCAFDDVLTPDEALQLKQAHTAAVFGDSTKVPPALIEANNARYYPSTVQVAAAKQITVVNGEIKTFGQPNGGKVQVHVGALTVDPGGQIEILSDTSISGQVSEVHADAETTPHNINATAVTPTTPTQPDPQPQKGQGPSAVQGHSSGGKHPKCVGASPAAQGDSAYPSTPGGKGQNGVSPANYTHQFDVLEGTYNVLVGGGDGAHGGKGGDGAQGANGGNGVAAVSPCGALPPAKGMKGADGGEGGMPGDGAPGSYVTLYYTTKKNFTLNQKTVAGFGGDPGSGGAYGKGGNGGADPGGTQGPSYDPASFSDGPGQNGPTGNGGQPGVNAKFPGKVLVQYKPQPG